jgi:hypothetical protein
MQGIKSTMLYVLKILLNKLQFKNKITLPITMKNDLRYSYEPFTQSLLF